MKKADKLADDEFATSCNPVPEDEWQRRAAIAKSRDLAQIGAVLDVLRPQTGLLFDQLQLQVNRAMQIKGFWDGDQDNLLAKLALAHSELSELAEAFRKGVESDDKVPEFSGEEAEAADTIIRLLDMAGRWNWRLGEAIVAKMHFNLSRPHKHGKKC